MNYKILIVGIFIGLVSGILIGYVSFFSPKLKLQICPDEWIINKMPGSEGSQCFIFEGKKVEISNFDIDWVRSNCEIEPQVVW